jgi:MFS family permease
MSETKSHLPLNYWKLWSASFISNVGNGVTSVAFPWLASALTRSPLTIAVVGLLGQLPWLLFTLPAGVITDRLDRKKIIVATDIVRGLVTASSAFVIFLYRNSFTHVKSPTHAFHGHSTGVLLMVIMISAFALGAAEVLGNNTSQTFMPEVVVAEHLQKANGQMWTAEYLTNGFIGPALGSLLLGLSIYLPFFFDSVSFFASAALILLISTQAHKIVKKERDQSTTPVTAFAAELKLGFRWLMGHSLLRPMAITLGALNFLSSLAAAAFILYTQEILHATIYIFAILGTSGALGGMLGGMLGPRITRKIGDGPAMGIALFAMPFIFLLAFFVRQWYIFYILMFLEALVAVLWNLVTVSFRQTIIPTGLLGRVNSGYRFFGWGSMPLGSLVGGLIVNISEKFVSRDLALRLPYVIAGVLGLLVFLITRKIFTSEALNRAREKALSS